MASNTLLLSIHIQTLFATIRSFELGDDIVIFATDCIQRARRL